MPGFNLIAGFISTLIATLIGVRRGFTKDRKLSRIRSRETTIQNLRAIQSELERNKEISENNFSVISEMQERETIDSDHYVLQIYSKSGWESATGSQLSENLSQEFYFELQETYSRIESINEQIQRLRTEILYPDIGEEEEFGPVTIPNWSLEVTYWSEDDNEVKIDELGSVIKSRSDSLKVKITGIDFEEEITRLEKENEDEKGIF